MEHAWVVLASLAISKQMALASRVVWEQTALASLTVVKHKAWASRLAWEQTVGFFDGFHCFGFISMTFHAKFQDGPPPAGVYGCFGGQQLLEGFVGICAELHCVCQESDILRSRGCHNG